jgi:hypothetical protein
MTVTSEWLRDQILIYHTDVISTDLVIGSTPNDAALPAAPETEAVADSNRRSECSSARACDDMPAAAAAAAAAKRLVVETHAC